MLEINHIYNEDCLGDSGMTLIPDSSVDMILCDLPYGMTRNKWDFILPIDTLWTEYKRVIKPNGAIVLFSKQPFTSMLVMNNMDWFRYEWIWEKDKASGHLNAKKIPMMAHENILVFYASPPTYNAQKTTGHKPANRNGKHKNAQMNYGQYEHIDTGGSTERYPRTVQKFNVVNSAHKPIHPTQKPVPLLEMLIKTYTNEGELVLDNCMGSGSTAIACINTNRSFIGFEWNKKNPLEYYTKAIEWIDSISIKN